MDDKALKIVRDYIMENTDTTDTSPDPNGLTVFIVWKCKALQNWKYIIASSIYGLFFELTYDGDDEMWYLDAYKKTENTVISGEAK